MTSRRSRLARAVLACGLLGFGPLQAHAQRIELVGRGEPMLDRRIAELAASDFTVIATNLLVGRADTLHGTIVVADATVRIEGVVLGDLVVLGANVFLRPSGVVMGDVLNIGGGYYPSAIATVHGDVWNEPNAPYVIEYGDGVIRLIGTQQRPRFETEGLRGVLLPSYDRVDGLTIGAGGALLLPWIGIWDPRLRARLEYRTERQVVTGGAELLLERGAWQLVAGAERTTLTNEEWNRPRWQNTFSYLFAGNDYFDHYRSDRAYVEAARRLQLRALPTRLNLRLQLEDAASLPAGDPWTLFGSDDVRPNRPVDDGRIASAIAGIETQYRGETVIASVAATAELGDARMAHALAAAGPIGFFGRYTVSTDLVMAGFQNHTLQIDANFRGPLPGTDELPLQRWTMVGGSGTLYTASIGAFHGDRLVHVHTTYAIPVRGFRLPLLGPPTLELVHVAAMAWSRHDTRGLEQNVGVGARAGFLLVRFMVDPADTDRTHLGIGLTLPARARPWERPD